MDRALYIAMTGASATMKAQEAVSHNIANVGTVGFKAELLQQEARKVEGPGFETRFNALVADGGFDASSGPISTTGNDLDIALVEDRWLAVQDPQGNEAYTRAGDLALTPLGQLVTRSGLAVLGENGPVAVPPHQKLTIGGDGTLSIVPQGQGPETLAQVGRLKVVTATGNDLARGPDGLFRAKDPQAPPAPAAGGVLVAGALEGSNVNAAEALVQMISLSRQFEMQVKVLRTADENARAASSLLRMG
jgi:flagellar basal-body rod protein FlgF